MKAVAMQLWTVLLTAVTALDLSNEPACVVSLDFSNAPLLDTNILK